MLPNLSNQEKLSTFLKEIYTRNQIQPISQIKYPNTTYGNKS